MNVWLHKNKKRKKNPVKEISSDSGFEVSRTRGKFHYIVRFVRT